MVLPAGHDPFIFLMYTCRETVTRDFEAMRPGESTTIYLPPNVSYPTLTDYVEGLNKSLEGSGHSIGKAGADFNFWAPFPDAGDGHRKLIITRNYNL